MNEKAVCGHCGKTLAEHWRESEDYCFENTNGDLFTSEPRDEMIVSLLEHKYPDLHAKLVSEWKSENGHAEQ